MAEPSATCDEGRRQIPAACLASDAADLDAMLGRWVHDLPALAQRFSSPAVPHVVIDGFFEDSFARALAASFPAPDAELWHVYNNPLERKRACSDTARMPPRLRDALLALCGPSVVEAVRELTGLAPADALQADPYCHGGGLHSHSAGGKLDLHLDYSVHPWSGLERRFNLIVYLVPPDEPWEPSYGGALELRAAAAGSSEAAPRPGEPCRSVLPAFNRAVIFSTTAPSFHGFPAPIASPPHLARNSLALYYLTPARAEASRRSKALYVAAPGEPPSAELDRLRALRAERRLTREDWEESALGLSPDQGHPAHE